MAVEERFFTAICLNKIVFSNEVVVMNIGLCVNKKDMKKAIIEIKVETIK